MQENEIDLGEILSLILSKIKFIILFTVLGFLIAFLFSKFIIDKKYTSDISIFVKSTSSQATGDVNMGEITAAQAMAETSIVVLTDDIVFDKLSDMLLEDFSESELEKCFKIQESDGIKSVSAIQLRDCLAVTSVNQTEIIKIEAQTKSPKISAALCEYVADIAPDLLTRVIKAGSVETIGIAKVPTQPSSPNVRNYSLIGAMIGLILSVALVIIVDLTDNCISSPDELRNKFNVPVLAEIPNVDNIIKGGAK